MNETFHIRRIRLVNFHNFVDETLSMKKNLFLIGDNKSGKTTVLDAVHFALSAGVEMEFNAAARFGPRTEAGRNLASIVLRYDLERDVAQRGPSVTYVALEIEDRSGATHTFGAGAFATSLDAQPDVWGFVARGRALGDIRLCAEEHDGGSVRQRPRDRQELEELLGRGTVFDKGRYRTAVAQLLFRDRDAYERGLELIAAGKAYRDMVARARNLNDLFISLLPPPAESEFEEVRSALRAIEGIRSDLGDLDAELSVLRGVIEKLQEARRETEKIARYQFVGAELERRCAEDGLTQARAVAAAAQEHAAHAQDARKVAAAEVTSRDSGLRALQASEGATLLAREDEARRDTADAKGELDRARQDLARRDEDLRHAVQDARRAETDFADAKAAARAALESVANAAREHLDDQAAISIGSLADVIAGLEAEAAASPAAIDGPLAALQSAFQATQAETMRRAAVGEEEAKRLRSQAAAAEANAEELRRRGELLPELEGYGALLSALETEAPDAVPLYRLLELGPEVPDTAGAVFECLLGPRALGAIVVPPDQHEAARARVLAHGGGVEVIDPAGLSPGEIRGGTLPAALVEVGPFHLAAIARAWLTRVAGDVRVLAADELRGDAGRAMWLDGRLYEQGAESRVEPAPARYFGAQARARAAAEVEAQLRRDAERFGADARRADEDALAAREVGRSCKKALELLTSCAAAGLIARVSAAESARAREEESEEAQRAARDRVAREEERHSRLEARHAELAAAVARAGIADLRALIARMEADLHAAREDEKKKIDLASRASTDAEQRAKNAEEAAGRLVTAEALAQGRRDALLPLVEARYQDDLDDYVFRVMRGHQILPANVAEGVAEAERARARAFQWIDSSDGMRNERLWQKYAFRLDEADREVRDQTGRPVERVYEERAAEVRALQQALDERTRDLLERVVMAGLVRRLQGQVRDLHATIQGINRLAADLRFGTSRFQFSLQKRAEFQRLLDLLREESILQPSLREELRDFFQARLDDLRQAREGEVPEVLDYRRWFEYVLQVRNRAEDEARDLPRHRLRFGSTGEQAVPTYLLVIAVASLLYDRTDARLRVLLLDEAFLGIDAGRREVLMQFADRAGVDLIVATPELDGVTPALAASSTLLIEKTPEQDVFVSDYHWERPAVQPGLFERPSELAEADLVLGPVPVKDTDGRRQDAAADADASQRDRA
jgi:hypothetical protein